MPQAKANSQPRSDKPRTSEVDAYLFIRDNLKLLGWDTRNPDRSPEGRVYTQNECLGHAEFHAAWDRDRPENVVKVTDSCFWVIEAKRSQREIDKAVSEAEEYASRVNAKSKNIRVAFISGVAGNQTDGYLVKTRALVGKIFKSVRFNGSETSSLLAPDVAATILVHGPELADVPVNEGVFLATAERINEILHLGAINKDYRARVMAALLLSLVDETPPNIDASPTVLIKEINARAEAVLEKEGKISFLSYVTINLPAANDNHIKFKSAIVKTLQELRNLNIRAAMNSGADVLGKFYEVFLKYGNGAKEIGIVLTPRHITRFAVEAVTVTDRDIIFDPCCGTGGFLVAAFDHVRREHTKAQIDRFKRYNLFGVDQEAAVVSLAIVNMIFRGDGKNNIIEGNTFRKNLTKITTKDNIVTAEYSASAPEEKDAAVTRVLMNPPFALPSSGEEKEFKFIDHALLQMRDGGILFCVLPYGIMVRGGVFKIWRETVLKSNSLLSVVTFPPDIFYPVGVHTVGIFIKKGVAHKNTQNVLWVRAVNDGLLKNKGKRLPSDRATDDIAAALPTVRSFLLDVAQKIPDVSMFQRACAIDFSDPILELVPENYLSAPTPTADELATGVEDVLRGAMSYMMRAKIGGHQ